MAAVKLRHQKQLTLSGIQRLEKSFILDRNAIIQKIQARIRQERSNLLQSRRQQLNDEDETISACRSAKETFYKLFNQKINVDNYIAFEEEVTGQNIVMYEEWLISEAERAIEEEEEEGGLVCPVCCRHLLRADATTLTCPGCDITYAHHRTIEAVRSDIKHSLDGHHASCRHCPVFTYVADSKHTASMLLLCHFCSYLNVIL